MPKTIYFTATSLDGFLADEHDNLDWLLSQDIDHEGPMSPDAFMTGVGAIVMGRTTYEWVLRHMREAGEPWYYEVPTWVMSHHPLEAIEGADIRFAAGDVGDVHAQMAAAAGDRDRWVVGGGDLAAQFAGAGLLDEVHVSIAPVTLGAGRPLFTRPFDLRLTEVARNRAFACARYEVVGPRG